MIIKDAWRDGRKITDRMNGVKFTNRHGDIRFVAIFVNQGWRECILIDRDGADFLLEYEMPGGNIHYQEWTATIEGSFEYVRTINPKRVPIKWRGSIEQYYGKGELVIKPTIDQIREQLDYAEMQAQTLPRANQFKMNETTRWLVDNQRKWILHYIRKADEMLERLQNEHAGSG